MYRGLRKRTSVLPRGRTSTGRSTMSVSCQSSMVLDKSKRGCKTALVTNLEETMKINRRHLVLSGLAVGLLAVAPAFAGSDEDAVAKNLEAFRAAQAAANSEVLA